MDSKIFQQHVKFLKEKVFFVNTKWPHFSLLFDDIDYLSKNKKYKKVLSIERASLYGNISLLGPFFDKKDYNAIDCSTAKILSRGSYNKKYVQSNKIIKIPINNHYDYRNIKIKKNSVDLIIIPNLMHHIFDHERLLLQCKNILKKGGKLYIFEPTLREIHQAPNDYFRFTPFSLRKILRKIGFSKTEHKYCGGPFTAAAYCLEQALEYLPKEKRNFFKKKFLNKNMHMFLKYEEKYNKNLMRKNTIFPMSFSILSTL